MKSVVAATMVGAAAAHDFSICQGVTDTLGVTSVELGPDPAVSGEDLKVTINGKATADIADASVNFSAKVFGVQIASLDFSLCKDLNICNVKAGQEYSGSLTYPIPKEAPGGVHAKAEVSIKDTSSNTLSCLDMDVKVNKPSNKLFGLTQGAEENSLQFLFTKFVKQHGKEYELEEFFERYNTFKTNWQSVVHHNSEDHSWSKAMNQFGDMTSEEFKTYKTGFMGHRNAYLRSQNAHVHNGAPLADSVDWRTKNAVTPVKNQGQCGSCWAFSTTGSTEGANALKTGKLVSLSEQQLVDCSKSEGNEGCNGGLMDYGFEYIMKKGIAAEEAYPYEGVDGTCKEARQTSVATVSSYKDVTSGSEDDLLSAIAISPVSVAIEADQSGFQFYSGGVFDGACGKNLDHGVLAVGYGTDSGKAYYKVKNSWGASWGEAGYIRLGRGNYNGGAGQCGILSEPSWPSQ